VFLSLFSAGLEFGCLFFFSSMSKYCPQFC
jgi:hypothetical protein